MLTAFRLNCMEVILLILAISRNVKRLKCSYCCIIPPAYSNPNVTWLKYSDRTIGCSNPGLTLLQKYHNTLKVLYHAT